MKELVQAEYKKLAVSLIGERKAGLKRLF